MIKRKHLVILIHGFCRDQSDMYFLRDNLNEIGYYTITVNLPTFFSSFEVCTGKFTKFFNELHHKLEDFEQVHFVAHSMGGLILRSFLAENKVRNIGRCVLIATPNGGTKLADILYKHFKPIVKLFKPLEILRTNGIQINSALNCPRPDIGVIAGNNNNLMLGRLFLSSDSDGRVEVESTKLENMRDFIVIDFGHEDIHHQLETVRLVDDFLQTGSFT
ncbi:MAG: alpha/beta hydrolase [Bacillota bacterium]|nr:alpha/beta hydrolase [Bacillota bacterium]